MPATPDRAVAAYREFTAEQRKKLAEEGLALSDGSFPIETVDDLKNAVQSIGRAKDSAAAKAHIKKRARDLGSEDLVPEDWSVRARDEAGADGEAVVPQSPGKLVFRSDFSPAELALGEWFVQRFRAPDYIGMTDEPGENWVEQEGGLPSYIKRIANHLIGKGMTEGHAIASAVNTVKRWARGGTASKHGGGKRGQSHVKPATIAKSIVALAHWMAMRAAAAAHASHTLTFAAATVDEVAAAEADVQPDDGGDTMGAIRDGFDYLSEWLTDEANAEHPDYELVKQALDKVGPQLEELDGKSATASALPDGAVESFVPLRADRDRSRSREIWAATAARLAAAREATPEAVEAVDPADTGPAVAEVADPADTAPEAVESDDPGLDVPLAVAQAEYATLLASADSIVEELTTQYTAAVAGLAAAPKAEPEAVDVEVALAEDDEG